MSRARPYQTKLKQGVYQAWAAGAICVAMIMATGGGKCLGRDTLVLMFDGSTKKVQDIKPGDLVMGPDSKPRLVTSVCRGLEELYDVVPTKGSPYTVNASHILSLKQTRTMKAPKFPSQDRQGAVTNLTVGEYLAKSKTWRHRNKGWRTGVDFPASAAEFVIPPYMLGVWLGDGNSDKFSVTTEDAEIAEAVCGFADGLGLGYRAEKNSDASVMLHVVGKKSEPKITRGKSPVMSALRKYSLVGNKHVPHDYLTASRADRLEVLAGIIDTDGSYTGKGFDVVFKSRRLADDTVFLARSLGLAAYVAECQKTCVNNGKVGTYYRISISGHCDMVPCRLPRKRAAPRQQIKDVLTVGITLEPKGTGEYFGFELSGPDRLFLLGDFTVTHNTFVMGDIIKEEPGPVCAIAHRQELVGQISLALAREGIRHDVLAPAAVRRAIVASHVQEFGRSYYDQHSRVKVGGVDTITRMKAEGDTWFQSVRLVLIDEGHHVLKLNKWGTAYQLFPNARGLFPTATFCRADGKGLGRCADGLVDAMVEGPNARELIDSGYLTDYRVWCPTVKDLELSDDDISDATGDYNKDKVRKAVHKSKRLVGDVVEHYLRHAKGERGITFAIDVESATEIAAEYRRRGVPAECVSANTPDDLRRAILRRFKAGEVLQLVNVDLFGEGFDVPSCAVVSMARPTQSFSLFAQQFGRALRIMISAEYGANWDAYTDEERRAIIAASVKPKAKIIDHVGNIARLGLPDKRREWTLERRERRSAAQRNAEALRVCLNPPCIQAYEKFHPACPYCGTPGPLPASRGTIEQVEGDLFELDEETLKAMRGELADVDRVAPRIPGASAATNGAVWRTHHARQMAQRELRHAIGVWAACSPQYDDRTNYRRFWYEFGVDVLGAQSLGAKEADALRAKIAASLAIDGYVISEYSPPTPSPIAEQAA